MFSAEKWTKEIEMGLINANRPVKLSNISAVDVPDNSLAFLQKKMLTYMDRLIKANLTLGKEALEFFYWLVNRDLAADYVRTIKEMLPEQKRQKDDESDFSAEESWDFAHGCFDIIKLLPQESRHRARIAARKILEARLNELSYDGSTIIEENIREFKKMFNLDDNETELCLFLFILASWNEFQAFFENHLQCNRYQGRKWLAVILNCKEALIVKAISGKLDQIGILDKDNYRGGFELKLVFGQLLQDLSPGEFRTQFIKPVKCEPIDLDAHMIDQKITKSILNKLSYKPETSTHVLLYGPPGTGKTSYASGIAERLGLSCYQLDHGAKDSLYSRRAAIAACVNMACETDNALLIADDCDSILNTRSAWSFFGETPDKPWLHELLEKPGLRMIWTVNSVDNIEESVSRRFSFSLNFKPFNRQQRVQLWQNILKKHNAQSFLKDSEIEELSNRFEVSAGVIDQAIRKTAESRKHSDENFRESVVMAIESHIRLAKGGHLPVTRKHNGDEITLDGLNLSGTDPKILLEELVAFDQFCKAPDRDELVSMSLLFHGPAGTGKSHLARFIANHLEKEIVFKRASDLFSMWVGGTEKNIRDAYEEAQSKEAVLIFDEADSLVFSRDRAEHSWELSFTNEFLTWMESFQGIQIFTTNRLRDMDAASLRRFNHKVEFGYLKPDGNVIFYEKLVAPLISKPPDDFTVKALKGLSGLAPGDFKSVRDKFAFRNRKDITHKALVDALADEAKVKAIHAGEKNIGF
jgi:transitional endoplasmic reticulum ATPase